MKNLKKEILELKLQGFKQSEIATKLKCSTGTVSYHCNPKVKEKAIKNKRNRRKLKQSPNIHIYLDKELNIDLKKVCWKHAEAICLTRLIELGYEVFTPFNGGGEIDLIVFKDKQLLKIQIKSVSPTNKNYIKINTVRNSVNYKKVKNIPYENIDLFLIFDGTHIYKINSLEAKQHVVLRYKVPANNQVENIKMASDYIF